MKTPHWFKTSTLAMTTLAVSFGASQNVQGQTLESMQQDARDMGVAAKRALVQKIKTYDLKAVRTSFAAQQKDIASEERLRNDSDIHAALLFYCDLKISRKIAGFRTADDHELIQEDKRNRRFIVWQSDEQRADTLENIYSTLDPKTGFQICTTFDKNKRDLIVHLGGTDLENMQDLAQASLGLSGMIGPRSAEGATQADNAVAAFRQRHPELKDVDCNILLFCHSQGASAAPGAMIALRKVKQTVLLAPFAAETAFAIAEETAGIPTRDFRKNVVSILPTTQGLLNMFTDAIKPVGQARQTKVPGHNAENFVRIFNNQRAAVRSSLR